MRSVHLLLFFAPLLAFWASLTVTAAPIPTPPITASSNHPHHQQIAAQHPVHQAPVHSHPTNQQGHHIGTMAVDPAKKHSMTADDLHGHIAHIKAAHPNHDIHAAHKPGDDHVHFHATPSPHGTQTVNHAILKPGEGGVLAGTTAAEFAKKKHDIRAVYTHPTESHGRGLSGTMPVLFDRHKNNMSPEALEIHAQGVKHNLGAHGATVHVTHKPGDDHVHFHAMPAPGKDLVHPQYHHTPVEIGKATQIGLHLRRAGDTHYGASFTGNSDKTFKGTVPAHSREQMTPAELDMYAHHAHGRLVALHGADANNLVVAATHKEGDSHVQFHTAPRTKEFLRERATDTKYPQLNQKLNAAGHTYHDQDHGVNRPWHHAELGALKESLDSKQATAQTFDHHIAGHSIGVYGKHQGSVIDQPCANCHNTLAQLPVWYNGMQRDVNPGIQRAL